MDKVFVLTIENDGEVEMKLFSTKEKAEKEFINKVNEITVFNFGTFEAASGVLEDLADEYIYLSIHEEAVL